MSAWVLVIMFGLGDTTNAVAIDMPDRASCYAAFKDAMKERRVIGGFCLQRKG
jgi:hypothetical protein